MEEALLRGFDGRSDFALVFFLGVNGLGGVFSILASTSSRVGAFAMTLNPNAYETQTRDFLVARAEAINSYSTLEQHLCHCFSQFSQTEPNVAGAIFFKISAARSRRMILDDLKRQAIGVKYSGFWDSLLNEVARLDDRRNEIIHWTVAYNLFEASDGEMVLGAPVLKKPNYWAWNPTTPEIHKTDIENFSRRCEILSGALAGLLMVLRCHPGFLGVTGDIETWREICQRPLDDPLPTDHPLFQKPKAPEPQPQA